MSKWIYTIYAAAKDGRYIKPDICPDFFHEDRKNYVFETYGAVVGSETETDDLQIDFGGMIRTTDPRVKIEVDGQRTVSCWEHQISEVIYCLEGLEPIPHGEVNMYRFSRWPGVICYITSGDRDVILNEIRLQRNMEKETKHHTDMHEALVRANVREQGPEVEAKVRELLAGPKVNN